MQTHGVSLDTAMRGAGAWAVKKSLVDVFRAYAGKAYGPPAYHGEDEITGTRIDFGYHIAPSIPNNRPPPSLDVMGP